MPRIVDIEGVGLVEVDDRIGENQLLEFAQTLRQGALPAAGSALMREGGRMVGGAMMGLARLGLEEPPPIPSAAQAESPAAMAAYERRLAAWQKRTKEVPPEVLQARAAEIEAGPTFQMGQALQRGAEEAFPVSPLREQDYLTQLASGVGSLPVSAVPVVGQLAYGLSAAEDQAQRAGQVYDVRIADALAKGNLAEADRLRAEKPVKQYQSALLTAPIGAITEGAIGAVPAIGRAFTQQVGKRVAREILRTGAEEAAQETSEQLLSNLVAREVYNPEQKLGEGLYESGTVGGGVGALVGLATGGLGRVGRGQRLAQLRGLREERAFTGPQSERQIQEIIDRQAAGLAAIGGDPGIPLPNAAATLAGINSGGAPSGPIRITPPEEEAVLPEMALEEEAAGEPVITEEPTTTTPDAIQEQGADEGVLRGEEPQPEVQMGLPEMAEGGRPAEGAGAEAQAEVVPLTIEETQEYNEGVDLGTDLMSENELARFEELAGRVRQLEQAGFEFDEATGWTKPGVAPEPIPAPEPAPAPAAIAPAQAAAAPVSPEEIRARMEQVRIQGAAPAVAPAPVAAPTRAPAPALTDENISRVVAELRGQKTIDRKEIAKRSGVSLANVIIALGYLQDRGAVKMSPDRRTVTVVEGNLPVTTAPAPAAPAAARAPAPIPAAIISDENQALLKNLGITATVTPDGKIALSGRTFDWRNEISESGGRFAAADRSWRISPDGLGRFIERAGPAATASVGPKGSRPAYISNSGLRKLRQDADNRPDQSGLDGGVGNYVGEDTQQLMRRGEAFGIPGIVIDEQIEDVALMVQAFRKGKSLFMLASAPGTGKTFVLGAAIRELRRSGANKFVYVTLRKELITQIKQDLKDYGIGDVEFITYAEMKDRPPVASDVLIFDEAHAIKNLSGEGSEQAKKAQEWILKTKFPVLSTATPFENPVQAAYLANTRIFDPFNGFRDFALAYGATPVKSGDGTILVWKRTNTSDADQVAARNFFKKEGIFTARKTRLPQNQVDSRLVKVTASDEYTRMYKAFENAVKENEGALAGFAKAWIKNFQKRILEASKIDIAINEANNALKAGRWPIVFVETKAERKIDIPDLQRREAQWQQEVGMARRMGERPPPRSEFGLPPLGITDVLSSFMDETGISVIEIPSAEDAVKARFGEDNVAIFTGSVTPAKAQKNLDKWRGNKPMVLVATMAKGGTGLSLHDKTGNHPTTQINVNLPWTATQVEQVSLRSARYGLKGTAQMQWLFADNIPFDRQLAQRVGARMADMGAIVHGELPTTAASIQNWNFEDDSFSEQNADQADKQDLIKQEAAPTPPAAPAAAPAAPTVTAPVAAPAKGRKAREWTFKGDILDDIIALGGVMSRSQAKKEGRLEGIKSLYDDAPRLDPYFNKIFGGRQRGEASRNQPDTLLQELATENPGKYGDMTMAEFWAEVEKAARGRKGDVAALKAEQKAAEEGAAEAQSLDAFLQAQDEAFVDAQTEGMQRAGEPDGPIEISVGDLAMGDRFYVQGELFEVTSVTPEGQYTIRDGQKFGVQQLTEYDTLFVDKEPIRTAAAEFMPEGAAPAQLPRLGAMQQQGDLLAGQQEAFALVGEKGVDYEKKQREAQAAARAAAEAKAAQERAQTTMPFAQSAIDTIDKINKAISENQYSDLLFLTPLAKLALQIAKRLIQAGIAVDQAIRQAIAQARQQLPNDPASDAQLAERVIRDAQYAQAVAAGDMETAQQMVDEAAKAAGYTTQAFRSNDSAVNTFDTTKRSAWFTSDLQDAQDYGGTAPVSRYYIDAERFADLDTRSVVEKVSDLIGDVDDLTEVTKAMPKIRERLRGEYDGIRLSSYGMGYPTVHISPFHADAIKSADTITRDDAGNVIPLSRRFQADTADIRGAAEAKAAQEKAQTQMDLGGAVAEASDAIAQFVESITPKAGITEGPTPEESARRVLDALTKLASVAIRAGIQSASQWATSLRLKLGPALQHAWDRAQGSAAEPTPEIIADVANLPEQAATDFGMIYSTPGEPVTTKRGAFEDTVAGRRALTPEVRDAGIQLAIEAFNEAGVNVRQVADGLFAPVEGVNQEDAGRRLISVVKDRFQKAKAAGRSDTMYALINSLRNHFAVADGLSPETRDELYLIGQSEASEFGRNLASLNVSVKDFVALARNVRGFLTSAIYDAFSGREVTSVLDKIVKEFRGQFTEEEIQKIVGEKPDLQQMLNRFGVLALADTGGRVYRAVQARLKTKKPPTQKAKEQRALEDEAIDQIIENALALGVTEPAKPPGRKLTPDERLALMTRPATQAKVQKATEDAVKEAEFNAGWRVMMTEAAGDEATLAQYRDAMAAGEDPTPEAIEAGLDLPQYAHWRTIRDGFLNYSPTTLKLAQDVIRGRFKGTQFGAKKVAPPAPAKIDLVRLVQQPNAEMSRVIGEQLAAIERVMSMAGASPEAKARVMQMITANVGSQVQLARQRVLNNFLDVKAKTGPTTASDRLQRLINAGITEDPRYRSQKTRDLLKRVAKTYLNATELSGLATRTRQEKLAFLTGKLNQITAAEKLTDEWMQGAVWTYLTERMMEAENAAVAQIVGAKDVSFDPAQPKTEAQVAAERAKAVERLAGGIRAGLLDQRIAESVAKNPALQRLVPKMSDLVKRVLETPQVGQAKLAKAFSDALLAELAIDQALADKTGLALAKAFQAKFERARIQALDRAVKKLTPKEREEVGPGRPLWQKIEEFVNAGGMNSAALLQSIAKKAGWKVPTEEEVSRLRDLARMEQELSTATEEEIKAGMTDDIKAAKNEGKRTDIMREIQMRWARMTMPIRGNKENRARAINEITAANLLFKLGFVTKQLIDTATQMFYYTPTRAVATAAERYRTSRDPNRANRLWRDTGAALEDAYKSRFQALNMALTAALEAAKGRAERDTIMGIQSGIRALDRINAQATEYAKQGDYARATVLRMIGISQLSFRFASSLDAFQGVLAEQQEIGAWAESQLRLQGMAPEQARKTAKTIIGDALAEYALAQALVGDDPNITAKERRAAAWNVVRARQYQRIKAAGLDVDALRSVTQDLRSTIGWNVEETGGLGGVIGQGMKNASDFLARTGIPNPVGRFSNAIAIGINRGLTFAGGGFVPKAFEGSAWYKTETDKAQRKIEAATGLGLSGALAALVLSGALRVFTRWPDDKEEADLWEREGHRPNTMELDLPGGKFLRVSLNTGPIQVVRPVLAAIGELQYQVARRNRLNQKAEATAKKKGLAFEPRELTAKDIAGALSYGAYSAVAQGRTASGIIGSGVYRQTPDLGKVAAGAVSPLIPFQPLVREVTAMAGPQFNPKDQTFINLLVPTPWSGKADRNFLGDPVGTPRAQERIMSMLTGGTAIAGGEETDRAYQVLAKTGWTPATPQSNKFFQFGRVQRQATPEELTRMQEVRAIELKRRISQLDPATATRKQLDRIEDIANANAKKSVGAR